jgi:hypothetical protein
VLRESLRRQDFNYVSILGSIVTTTLVDSIPDAACLELNPAPLTAVIGRAPPPPPPTAVPIPRFIAVPGTGTAPRPKAIIGLPMPPPGSVRAPVCFRNRISMKNHFLNFSLKLNLFYWWRSSAMTCFSNSLLKLLIII